MARKTDFALAGSADPLLAAIVAKLPPAGSDWPLEQQAAWLRMMAMAFGVVYRGGEGLADMLELPAFLAPRTAAATTAIITAPPKPVAKGGPRFLIDKDGIARRNTGEQILPSEVTDILYDERGEAGDLGAIVWADGSRGVAGHQLDISTSV